MLKNQTHSNKAGGDVLLGATKVDEPLTPKEFNAQQRQMWDNAAEG
jgi:hypothetical protein